VSVGGCFGLLFLLVSLAYLRRYMIHRAINVFRHRRSGNQRSPIEREDTVDYYTADYPHPDGPHEMWVGPPRGQVQLSLPSRPGDIVTVDRPVEIRRGGIGSNARRQRGPSSGSASVVVSTPVTASFAVQGHQPVVENVQPRAFSFDAIPRPLPARTESENLAWTTRGFIAELPGSLPTDSIMAGTRNDENNEKKPVDKL